MSNERKKSLIRTFLKLSGFEDEYLLAQDTNFTLLQQKHDLPEEDFVSLYKKYGGDCLKERIVDVYVEEFSEKEIEELIHFWSEGPGKKIGAKSFRDKQKKLGGEWAIEVERSFFNESKKKDSHEG